MKQFNYSSIISSVFLGTAFVIGCLIINGNVEESSTIETKGIVNANRPLMTIQETAEYLNISELQVRTIISTEETMLKSTGSYTGMMFPIIKIGNDIYVSTNGLNDWLKESIQERKQY